MVASLTIFRNIKIVMKSSESYYVGIDVGTTNAKCVIIDQNAKIVTQKSKEYCVDTPYPGWSEQNPEMWWETIFDLCQTVIGGFEGKQKIKAIGTSGQMHGLVTLDEKLNVIRPAILWNDQRSKKECDYIVEQMDGLDHLLALTNNNILTGYAGPKLLWLKNNEKEHYDIIHKIILPKDYIRYKLTGTLYTDVSDASGTGFFDVINRCWSKELLERLDIPVRWFPEALESMDSSGVLKPELAEMLGIKYDIPVIAGAGDAVIQPLASGILDSSEGLLVIGTGGNVTVQLPGSIKNQDGKLQVFCGVMPGSYVAMGVTLSAGDSLRWIRDLLQEGVNQLKVTHKDITFADIEMMARQSQPGANNLLFLPYLAGERCPYPDPKAKAVFLGMQTTTSLADMARSIMEGVSFSLKDVVNIIEKCGFVFKSYCFSGGGAQSELWRQILAHILNAQITTVTTSSEGSAFGVALLAGLAAKEWIDPLKIKEMIPIATNDSPNDILVGKYRHLFSVYQKGYPQLKSIFEQLADDDI